MPVFGSFRMASSKACNVDPSASTRTFLLRGDGLAGVPPAADEFGNAVTFSGSATLAASPKYWADYSTAIRVGGAAGYVNLPVTKFELGYGGTPFSILLRLAIFGSGGQIIWQHGAGSGNWGPGGIQHHLWAKPGEGLSWQWYGSNFQANSVPSNLFLSRDWTDGAMHEYLIAYDGTTTRVYRDGALGSSGTGTYVKVNGSACRLGQDVSGGSQANIAINDLTVWHETCITTASSYTLPTLPPC